MACKSYRAFKGHCLSSQLGRLNGSKNKRSLISENKNERDVTRESNDADACGGPDLGQRQRRQQGLMPLEFNLEHGFDPDFPKDVTSDGNPYLLLDTNLASFVSPLGGIPTDTNPKQGPDAPSVHELNTSSHRGDTPQTTAMEWALHGIVDVNVSVGNFELTGGAREEAVEVVVRRRLENIRAATLHLWERFGRPRMRLVADLGNKSGIASSTTPESLISE
ncbi:hypothetical protein F5Y06DRAFT_299293 [Hypoxylon sp. FL0890]|nr:hypothetical protein F5Y06DRAFT_299293 [Hypoxylon sp. FL0890]